MRFYRDNREVAIDEVPAILYSEVMRDVDLFTSVSAVGGDEAWADQGDRGTGIFSEEFNVQELSGLIGLRRETLSLSCRTPRSTAAAKSTRTSGSKCEGS